MNIVITGGAGFVGYHLADYISKIPDTKVLIIDDLSRGKKDKDFEELISRKNVFFKNEINEPIGADYIIHCAAVCGTKNFYEKPYYTLVNNIQSIISLIEKIRSPERTKVLFTSTSETYSGNANLPIPTPEIVNLSVADVFNPRWSYASSKIVGEQLFIHGAKQYGFRYSIVRLHNIYGERMGYEHIIPGVMKRILDKQEPFEIIGRQETRSFCYIKDGAEAMWQVLTNKNTDGKIVNIGKQEETKIGEVYKKIFNITGYQPKETIYKDSPLGSVLRRCPDVSLLEELTGYKCKTNIDKGIKKTWQWYKNE